VDISTILNPTLNPFSDAPLYQQIAEQIAAKIQSQTLPAGTRLLPERQLAELYKVSRTTAINAYRELESKGLVITKLGSGTFVASNTETLNPPVAWHQLLAPYLQNPQSSLLRDLVSIDVTGEIISLATGMPDPALYPIASFEAIISKLSGKITGSDLGHIATEGYLPLRTRLAEMQNKQGISCTAENIAIVSGSQQGLYLLLKAFITPGDYVVAEAPTYLGALPVFQATGARILSLPAPGPLRLDVLEDYLVRYRPKLLYIMPTYQNPSGRVLKPQERLDLLTLAAKHRLVIIEDDPYSKIYFDHTPPASLKALDSYGGVIYLSTMSKTIFPGLRIGWVTAPPAVINRIALEKQYIDLHTGNLSQWLLNEYLADNIFTDHLELIRSQYKARCDAVAHALQRYCGDKLIYSTPSGGFYYWCKLTNPAVSARHLLTEATRLGVTFVPGEAFYSDAEGEHEFRLCFSTNDEKKLVEGVKRLAKAIDLVQKFYLSQKLTPSPKPII
jgi:DNA-binding transcriptional MocR family regulator